MRRSGAWYANAAVQAGGWDGSAQCPHCQCLVRAVTNAQRNASPLTRACAQAPGGGACTLHVVLSRITRGRLGGEHWEVVGSCPQLRELLNNGGQGAEGEREALLGAILRWCAAVRDAL